MIVAIFTHYLTHVFVDFIEFFDFFDVHFFHFFYKFASTTFTIIWKTISKMMLINSSYQLLGEEMV